MKNQILDKIKTPTKTPYSQKSFQKFILALISSSIPIVAIIIHEVNYGRMEGALGYTILLTWIISIFWISVISLWGIINGIKSFIKKEKDFMKKAIILLGNIFLFACSAFLITFTIAFWYI